MNSACCHNLIQLYVLTVQQSICNEEHVFVLKPMDCHVLWLQLLTNAAVDIILQMCVESSTTLSTFIDMCSQPGTAAECFQKMALLWRVSTSEPNILEKVSIFLQKLSKIRLRSPF